MAFITPAPIPAARRATSWAGDMARDYFMGGEGVGENGDLEERRV
jgi:hypothetical protein